MARTRIKPQLLLVEALKAGRVAAKDDIVKSSSIGRKYREILVQENCLTGIIKGWYLLTSREGGGTSTAWFGGFWAFLKHYLTDRFGANGFCLSAESSFNLHAGDTSIPRQLIILTKKASNARIELPHDTSILLVMDKVNFPKEREKWNGLWVMRFPYALCRLSPSYFQNAPRNVEVALKSPALSLAEISRTVFKYETFAGAERIIGAYKHLGETRKGEQIKADLVAAGYKIKEIDPFVAYEPKLNLTRPISPCAARIYAMWHDMRKVVIGVMPVAPGIKRSMATALRLIQEKYKEDAYHSLSIEGYKVTTELIERIESGEWDPENNEADRHLQDALAAKGYYEAFKAVVDSLARVLKKENPGQVFTDELQTWYRQLFSPFVKAGKIPAAGLAGYRDNQVYISGSRHVPPSREVVSDCMEELFELLRKEENPAVRAVLGHFVFVFIHPYMDGNGRIARFLMNLMLISGGYRWMIIKIDFREQYMAALEEASAKENILPFAKFIKDQME
ncbi:MAG: Fic family protein [Proteobacteria bacterium]|nr:Fic family protein [Pseudomonadota bacterium]MBU1714708.1 Fic family protein [Pseudomonadota bacterium]